jgi:uncharacterized protein (TIGR03085 family)
VTSHAQDERQSLADDLLRLGPEAETLCAGWQAADLAAHLVIRDRRPDAALGILVRPLAARTARIQDLERRRWSWPELVERVRSGPPYPVRLPPLDRIVNTVEYFVHHEDLLRAQPAALPRRISRPLEAVLWSRLRLQGRILVRRAPVGVVVQAPEHGSAVLKRSEPSVAVTGAPGELLLWAFGRQAAADVSLAGDPAAVARLEQASFGL